MYNPVSTYRVQLHKGFTLADLNAAVPYLIELGIGTLYASPVFEAVPGSTHGYDVTNPQRINPEIGTLEELRQVSRRLREAGIGWLQDIVPNHMAFHPNNAWLMDVLEKGQASDYYAFFDINLQSPDEKIMVPFLGGSLDEVLDRGELSIGIRGERHVLVYFDNEWPLNATADAAILKHGGAAVAGNDAAFLRQLLETQAYRLCHWQETDRAINYRRFFTVNGLISLNIQHPEAFAACHKLIAELVADGTFTGLRVDHIDGLHNPKAYLTQLRALAGTETYIVVEKILELGEELPADWPVQGTTGYEFLAQVNNLLTDRRGEKAFDEYYTGLAGKGEAAVAVQARAKKRSILKEHMAGERIALCRLFRALNLATEDEIATAGIDYLQAAIGEVLVYSPVYRYYGDQMPLSASDSDALRKIFAHIRKDSEALGAALALLEKSLIEAPEQQDADYRARALRFYQRLMQYSGPLMAKGVEDTLMYTYNRFVAHNEVGDAPDAFGLDPDAFIEKMKERQAAWPMALSATATHDTKRGEDARARLNVLSAMPDAWLREVAKWHKLNKDALPAPGPDRTDEYFLYQTLLATWPMPGTGLDDYSERLKAYLEKALREAKRHSNWSAPDEAYEQAMAAFAASILQPGGAFHKRFTAFAERIAGHGVVNSLTQLLIKALSPGMPDTYQGSEFWDLSFVDPDNRRPVDYALRQAQLARLGDKPDLTHLWATRFDGRIKLWLTQRLLRLRRQHAELFLHGHIEPLRVKGKHARHVFAFARRYRNQWLAVVVPLHAAALADKQGVETLSIDWKDTVVQLPAGITGRREDLLAGAEVPAETALPVSKLFGALPFALMLLESETTGRGAGILLPVASLPSRFAIGDFGPGARDFADFLARSRQKFWQLLPLNPTENGTGHSPYSSYSSFAGNVMLISPEDLVRQGLLDRSALPAEDVERSDEIDYEAAASAKLALFVEAWQRNRGRLAEDAAYGVFCRQHAAWLDDFALFTVLREALDHKPWTEWPAAYRDRDAAALQTFRADHKDSIEKEKWLQFIFERQWLSLKQYCNGLGISLFGDMPFYVSHDSVDVWANRRYFCLDEGGQMTGLAGVPPDYFSEDGQLWGMPTFNWNALKEDGYSWWLQRLSRNLELFDLLRIDHFRAMAEYWQVPAGEETARNGEWLAGPGEHFFQAAEAALGKLPLVAEDLGDNMEKVYQLRDRLGLPGMRVVQFAFGEQMATSVDIPHNYTVNSIVYTGTHDNNTSLGWYREESGKGGHRALERYVGHKVRDREVHLVLGRIAYASTARTAILPMQDVLGLNAESRINTPGQGEGNWRWRLDRRLLTKDVEEQLREWVEIYGR